MINIIFLIFSIFNAAALERIIDQAELNPKKPYAIYMHPGRATTIDLPCSISAAVPGTHGDVKIEIGPDMDSSLLVWLSSEASAPTNLTVRCGNGRVIIFDIIPSRSHQDYLKFKRFNSYQGSDRKLVATSDNFKGEGRSLRKKKLLKSSEDTK